MPIGLEFDRVIESVQFVPITKIYILRDVDLQTHQKKKALLKYTDYFFEKIHETWTPLFKNNLILKEIDVTNQDAIINILGQIILNEINQSQFCKIYVNVSTSTKLFGIIACNIASFFPQNIIPFYLSTSNYLFTNIVEGKGDLKEFRKHGLTKGPYGLIQVPILPNIKLNKVAKNILYKISENLEEKNDNVKKSYNLREIADLLNLEYTDQSVRQKISYWIKKLQNLYFINDTFDGNRHNIMITRPGILFIKLLKALNLLN